MASEAAAAREKLVAALDSTRYLELVERLVAAAGAPSLGHGADRPAAAVVPALARAPRRRLRRAVRDLPAQPTDAQLHRIRILSKRARQAAEAVAPVAGRRAAAFAKAAADVQTILGEHQDAVTPQQLAALGCAWRRAALRGG